MSRIDPTVKKETGYIAGWVLLLSAVMELVHSARALRILRRCRAVGL